MARQLLSGNEEDETAFRKGECYAARLYPSPLRPDESASASNAAVAQKTV